MTKASTANFTKSIAKLGSGKRRVNAIAFGPAAAGIGRDRRCKARRLGADMPLARPGQSAELAPAFVNHALRS